MKEKEILELADHNVARAGLYAGLRWISHPKNPATQYYVSQVVLMHCDDGEWRPGILYSDGIRTYCRRADDFAKFSEVKR